MPNQSLRDQIDRREATEQALRQSERQLRQALEERELLARDLHDNIVQAIYAVGMRLEEIQRLATKDPQQASAQLANAIEDLNSIIRDVRRYIAGPSRRPLSASQLQGELVKLVQAVDSTGAPHFELAVDAAAAECLSSEEANHVLHIAREALSNSLKHSRGRRGTLTLSLAAAACGSRSATTASASIRRCARATGCETWRLAPSTSARASRSTRRPDEERTSSSSSPTSIAAMATPEPQPIRVLLVEDHEIVRAGLRAVFAGAGIEVVGEAATVAAAIEAADRLKPDVVLMDVRLPDDSGVGACREMRAANPAIKVLFLTACEDEEALLETIFASADGYLLKEIGSQHLVQAVEMVASGLSVLNPSSADSVRTRLRAMAAAVQSDAAGEPLSAQERRVLALVAEGKTNKEIAVVMGLSPKTVKNYLSSVFQKLKVSNRSEAVARMMRGFE